MANQSNNQNQQNNKNVTNDVKKTAGSAFETVHNALETTEDIAMSAVDATKNAAKNLTGNADQNQAQQ